MSATGIGLAFGDVSSSLPEVNNSPANLWLILAMMTIVAGIAATFWADRRAPLATLIAAPAALICTWLGTYRYSYPAIQDGVRERNPNAGAIELDEMVNMINVDWEIGFWLTTFALLAATGMAWLVYSGRADEAEKKIRSAVSNGASSIAAAAAVKDDGAPSATGENKPDE